MEKILGVKKVSIQTWQKKVTNSNTGFFAFTWQPVKTVSFHWFGISFKE